MAQQPSDYQYLKTPQRVVVISDLHLGGRPPATGVDTRMCGDEGAKDLEKFVAWVRTQHSEHWPIHLIVNGDILDFLAERNDRGGYDAFTPSESEAHRKMCRILGDPCYAPVFVQLAEFVKLKGARLTLLMGNHDVELSLPAVRRELLERLGPGSVEFIADNEGLALGCLLVEHGNRYDGWNYLKHNQLRACRSLMTRADPRAHFDPPPGSELVVKVLNELKPLFPFIDLLKPEDEVTLRIVRMLAPPSRKKLRLMLRAARGYVQQLLGKLRQGATGGVGENAAAPTSDPRSSLAANSPPEEETEAPPVTRALNLSLIRIDETEMLLSSLDGDLSSGDDASGGGILRMIEDYLARRFSDADRRSLHKSLRFQFMKIQLGLNIEEEREEYRSSAKDASHRGFRVIVYGHTHLPKRVILDRDRRGQPTSLYLNTGTWADLMFIDPSLLADGTNGDEANFAQFVADLRSGSATSIYRYRQRYPCYAQIYLHAGGDCDPATDAGLYRFDRNRPDGRQILGGILPNVNYAE